MFHVLPAAIFNVTNKFRLHFKLFYMKVVWLLVTYNFLFSFFSRSRHLGALSSRKEPSARLPLSIPTILRMAMGILVTLQRKTRPLEIGLMLQVNNIGPTLLLKINIER